MSTATLTAHCHCTSTHFTITLPASSLPLPAHLCHCTLCRTTYGTPATFHAALPEGIKPSFIAPSNWDNLTKYLPRGSKEPLYFCSTCGCHVAALNPSGIWGVVVSAFVEGNRVPGGGEEEKIWVIDEHIYTEKGSTGDGGIAELVPSIGGEELKVWNPDEPGEYSIPENPNPGDTLLAQCNCGGISFSISRPREEFINSPKSAGWVRPSDPKKWLALLDVCTDCRLVTGSHVSSWLFVPTDHITPPLPSNLVIGTTKRYKSSPGVERTFCGTCGATVFFYDKKRGGIIDIATGILRAPEGVMLSEWAVWRTAKLGYMDDGLEYDKEFTEALEEGMKEWAKKVHGAVVDFGGAGPEAD
ncbi:Mss4-like protein [Aspergillus carlsbadensis]|nr:Mss4-like protein [Aspergillus carlsbadensis]